MSTTIEKCEVCGGNGEYEIPAHQEGGEVVDGQMVECACQKYNSGERTQDEE